VEGAPARETHSISVDTQGTKPWYPSIDLLPTLLSWADIPTGWQVILNTYESRIRDLMTLRLDLYGNRAQCDAVRDLLEALPSAAARTVLLAPEVTKRLRIMSDHREAIEFLIAKLGVELALQGGGGHALARAGWAATGAAYVREDQEIIEQPRLLGCVPIDFDSPFAQSVDVTGTYLSLNEPRRSYVGKERRNVLGQLYDAGVSLSNISGSAEAFFQLFTRDLTVSERPDTGFTSGSLSIKVGRTTLGNPHLVDSAELADALLHEAIHSMLYMHQLERPWFRTGRVQGEKVTAVSPWTGRTIPVEGFLQACFVWFGLYNFWNSALAKDSVRTNRARRGFLKASLESYLPQGYRETMVDEYWAAARSMQEAVRCSD